MNLSLLKPKNIIVLVICILLNAGTINLFAQDVPNDGGNDEPDPFPENNLACQHLCPEVNTNLSIAPLNIGGVYHYYVYDALYLYDVLSCLYQDWQMNGFPTTDPDNCFTGLQTPITCSGIIPSCTSRVIVNIMQDIDLGLLPASVFPLEVSPGVTIQGSYELKNIDHTTGKSTGTRIYFPYLYEAGTENTVPRQYLYEPNASCNNDPAFVFKLNSGAAIKNVCLIGPKTDIKDWRWAFWFKNNCMSGTGSLLPAHEGVVGGILISGNKCEVSGCEIYGFSSFGILVRDMVVPLTNHAFDWGQCYDIRNPNDKGTATIANNYIHYCKAYGIYVSNPVYKYTSDKYPLPTEEAFITNNTFKNNQRNIVYSGKNVKVSIANNRYM